MKERTALPARLLQGSQMLFRGKYYCWSVGIVNKAQGQARACSYCPENAALVDFSGDQKCRNGFWMVAAVTHHYHST